MMRPRIILVRHGETSDPTQFFGSKNVPLSKRGHEDAELLAKELAHYQIDCIYTSDLDRCVDTAREIAKTNSFHERPTHPGARKPKIIPTRNLRSWYVPELENSSRKDA